MKAFMLAIMLCINSVGLHASSDSLYTQSYLNESTRFAWLTYGFDVNILSGGRTQIIRGNQAEPLDFGNGYMPRLTIGGMHFWGHADFYVSFPLGFLSQQSKPNELQSLEVFQGVETGARVYPWKVQPNSLRPFVGMSFRRLLFSQEAADSPYENGTPTYGRFVYPLQLGLTYSSDKWHISASTYHNFQNEFQYYAAPDQKAEVQLDPFSFNISFLRYIDTDRSTRKKGAAAEINQDYQILEQNNLLSAWFMGIGPSSALQSAKSPYLQEQFPYFYDNYSATVMPDITFGRYFHKGDWNLNLSYRTYGDSYEGFDNFISTRRHSVGVESVKFLFNYLGFVPFVGPIISHEFLHTRVNGTDYRTNKWAAGITFGWDIRVTKTGTGLLRTNLRYYPDLNMRINGEKMMFNHLEFNFIQWVQYFGRKKALYGR